MPSFIIKPKRTEDFYVLWSTIVDAPTAFGSREDLSATLGATEGRAERFDRAEEFGTSMCDPELPPNAQWFGWNDEEFIIREVGPIDGHISRNDLRTLCERLDTSADVSDLIRPFPEEATD